MLAGGADSPPRTPSRPRPRRRPLTVGDLHLGQVLCWELAVAAVIATLRQPNGILVPVVSAAVVVLALTSVHVRGRWLYQWLGLATRFVFRRRRTSVPAAADAPDRADAVLGLVARGVAVESVEVEREQVGVIAHGGGVTALLEAAPVDAGILVDTPAHLPQPGSLLPLGEGGDPAISTQLVVHVVPAPPPADEDNPVALSYRQLTAGRLPAERTSWIAVQALRSADAHSETELRRALVGAVRRMRRRLRKDGLAVRPLDPDEARAVVARLAHVSPATGPTGKLADEEPVVIREQWRRWVTPAAEQECFRLRRWPDLGSADGRGLLDQLGAVSTLGTTVGIAARRRDGEVEYALTVRIATADRDTAERASRELGEAASRCDAELVPLTGLQAFGVAETLPLGGFLP